MRVYIPGILVLGSDAVRPITFVVCHETCNPQIASSVGPNICRDHAKSSQLIMPFFSGMQQVSTALAAD